MFRLFFASPEEFTTLRELLGEAHYTEAAICERFGQPNLLSVEAARVPERGLVDCLDVLVCLLLQGLSVTEEDASRLMPPALLKVLMHLGLIRSEGSNCRATVMLHPWRELYVASDSVYLAGANLPADFVFPALTPQTERFLGILPAEACTDFLDLGAGTGIAGLDAAARYARQVWACDLTERAARFAEFNRRLNGLSNFTAMQGDLYAPVDGQTFDRIVAHPPYVPSLRSGHVYRDGGEDGEQITRRIVEGLRRHLRPGGRLYCTTMFSDRRGRPLEERLRSLLGPAQGEFDLLVACREALTPLEYGLRLGSLGQASLSDIESLRASLEQLEVERLVTCSLVAQRHDAPRGVFTVRRQMGTECGSQEIEWLRGVETLAAQPGALEALMEARPCATGQARLRVQNRLEGRQWVMEECWLETARPFPLRLKCPPWAALLLSRSDGRATLREHLALFQTAGALPADAKAADFARFVQQLVSAGLLDVAGELRI